MPDLIITSKTILLEQELALSFARSGGPGGQNVNKLNTKATLRWAVLHSTSLPEDVKRRFLLRHENRLTAEGEILITSQRYREAGRNAEDCRTKLRTMILAVLIPPKSRKATRPTKGSVRRRLGAKSRLAGKKQDRRPSFED